MFIYLNNKKAQSAVELVIIVSVVLYLFIIFLSVMQFSNQEKIRTHRNIDLQEIVTTLNEEINLAQGSIDGYSRTFNLPTHVLNGIEYNITILGDVIYAITLDEKTSYVARAIEIEGQPIKGENIITKRQGNIRLNT